MTVVSVSNFDFLRPFAPDLAEVAIKAERVFAEPDFCIVGLRKFAGRWSTGRW